VSESIFLDTAGWLAATNPKDSYYQAMSSDFDERLSAGARFVTSNLVLAELHAVTVRDRGTKAGCALLDAIYSDPAYRVIAVDRDLESRAIDNWLRKYVDTRFSLTDAVSFQIMKDERISKSFSIDHHFEVAGFTLVPSIRHVRAKKKSK
jgi:predicted nucleic acid-binding protein